MKRKRIAINLRGNLRGRLRVNLFPVMYIEVKDDVAMKSFANTSQYYVIVFYKNIVYHFNLREKRDKSLIH